MQILPLAGVACTDKPSPIRQWDAKRSGWQPAVSKDVNQDAWQSVRGAQSGGARHRITNRDIGGNPTSRQCDSLGIEHYWLYKLL